MSFENLATRRAPRFHLIKPGYGVDDEGRVWSCITGGCRPRVGGRWRLLKPTPQYQGHLTIWLGRDDQRFVHRLVLEAFVGPCPEGMECRHLDGNPANNRVGNLCWGTPKENGEDRIRHGTSGKGSHAVLAESDVLAIVAARRIGVPFATLAARYRVHGHTLQAIMYGRSWSHLTGIPPYRPQSCKPGRRPRGETIRMEPTSDNRELKKSA